MSRLLHLIMLTASTAAVVSPAHANQALAKEKSCMGCHGIDHKVVGPGYLDVARKYRGQAGAEARLVEKVLKGGKGVWGPVGMPANTQVDEAQARQLVTWILSLK
jgi:cytochrome c